VCYFGTYSKGFVRNKILIDGLIENGVNVVECNEESPPLIKVNKGKYIFGALKRGLKLLKKYLALNNIDLIIVGYPGFESVLQIKCLTKKPIIYDPFISSYLSYVHDYKIVASNSIMARMYYFFDSKSFKQSDLIISDTDIHGKILSRLFTVDINKLNTVQVGSNPKIFYPREYRNENGKFVIGFYGTYIPLHGVNIILEAAKRLKNRPNIVFELVGGGTENEIFLNSVKFKIKHKLTNVKFIPHIPLRDLVEKIAKSDIQLGIFGGTLKSNIVIPNKVYSALAMAKPIITSDTIASRELLNHEKSAYLCKNADPESLAQAIIALQEDKKLRDKIARNGYSLFEKYLTPKKLGNDLKNIILKLL